MNWKGISAAAIWLLAVSVVRMGQKPIWDTEFEAAATVLAVEKEFK